MRLARTFALAVMALPLLQCFIGGIGIEDVESPRADSGADARTDADAGTCSGGTVRFRLFSTSNRRYCVGAPSTCAAEWLTVRRHDTGEVLPLDRACVADCTSCQPTPCPASCAAPSPLLATGQERRWDGTFFPAASCDGGSVCAEQRCAPRGHYVARMCAYRDVAASTTGACVPVATASCIEVELDWPPETGTAEVLGVLDDGERPRCCPPEWQLLPCTDPTDAGARFNCHDPAMGCASSSTCGEGCDFAVTGTCGPA